VVPTCGMQMWLGLVTGGSRLQRDAGTNWFFTCNQPDYDSLGSQEVPEGSPTLTEQHFCFGCGTHMWDAVFLNVF